MSLCFGRVALSFVLHFVILLFQDLSFQDNFIQKYLHNKMFMLHEQLQKHKRNFTKTTLKQFSSIYDLDHRVVLGKGTFGQVCKTVNAQGKEVALKLFNHNAARQINQIIREVNNLKLLDHSNIARFYDCYLVDQNQYYIVIQYCPGGSLTSYLEKNNLSDTDKMKICQNIAEGLAYAHDKKVIHRDLKPDNILIGRDGIAKICDFGCSTQLDSEGEGIMETIVGSPAYWDRPLSKSQTYDQTVDIYAMGMIFFSVFKGKGIYDLCQSKTELNELRNKIDEDYETNMDKLLENVPSVMTKIIKNCMQTDSRQRYSAREVSSMLKTELDSKSSSKLSKLMSTVENEDIEDQTSMFIVKLLAYYRRVDVQNNKLGSRRALLQLLRVSSDKIKGIELLCDLRHIEPKTKEQYFTLVVYYYFFWLSSLRDFLNESNSAFGAKYPEIILSALQEEVLETALNHIQAEFDVYFKQFQRCCKNISKRIKLVDAKIYMPEVLKNIVGRVGSGLSINYGEFEETEIKEEMSQFFQKRMRNEFRRSLGQHQDEKSAKELQILEQFVQGL